MTFANNYKRLDILVGISNLSTAISGILGAYNMACQLALFSLLALSSVVSAQLTSILGLSDSCNKAMGQLVVGPAGNCLNTMGLMNVLTTPSGQSWVEPFDKYLTTTCGQPACPIDTLYSAIISLKDACSSDLAAKGWSADDIATILQQASGYYPSAREVLCLRDTGNTQKLCITTTLCNVQAMLGQPLNIGTLVADTPRILSSHSINVPKNISCTPCTQGAYSIARPNLPSAASVKAWDDFWISQCGEDFIVGNLPSNVYRTDNETIATATPQAVTSNAQPKLDTTILAAVSASLALASISALWVLHA
ncbi:hypothetical protein CTheo_7698 [Ceratobasidium theobromae]|uniref:Transmembrane protein n=1 Tax=Ceratobasidium theobromae TaxID=1582974 RepID=A0A5N5QAS8_9AGAM|nr:hypothetical protein CTheo_7698 [Ceratobasidium theobromae]